MMQISCYLINDAWQLALQHEQEQEQEQQAPDYSVQSKLADSCP